MRKLKIINRHKGICIIINLAYCNNIISKLEHDNLMTEMQQFLHSKGWHSGDYYYPIKHPRFDPIKAFCKCFLWTHWTTYGRRRRATLAHLNKYLEELRNA